MSYAFKNIEYPLYINNIKCLFEYLFRMVMLISNGYSAFICFVCLILYIPSKIFQLCRDGSSWYEPVLS